MVPCPLELDIVGIVTAGIDDDEKVAFIMIVCRIADDDLAQVGFLSLILTLKFLSFDIKHDPDNFICNKSS